MSGTLAENLGHTERSPGWLRWGGAICLVLGAIVLAVEAVIESAWLVYPFAGLFVLAAFWWCWLAKITITVDDRTVTLRGPAWKCVLQRQPLRHVSVKADSGMTTGLVNWPVVSRERGRLTRLNLGGSAAVTFSDPAGHRYRFVLGDHAHADLVAAAIAP